MVSQQTVCLRQLAGNRAREVQFGRWLANHKVTPDALMKPACARTGAAAVGRHVLAIQDTTELNHQAHAGRVRGLGTVGNGRDVGLFLHPLLVVDATEGTCLGLAHLHHWIRTKKTSPHHYRQLPIEDRESYRWLDVACAGKKCLSGAERVTLIADRESDIYEEWARLPDARTDLLTRVCRDRTLATGGKLYAWNVALIYGPSRPKPHLARMALMCRPVPASAAPMRRRWKCALGVSRSNAPPPAQTNRHRNRSN
jgi:hypothetical protein